MSPQDRIYSEEEIGRMLQRAAEIQGKQPRSSSHGLTLEEIQQLAAETGLDPSFVSAAAVELDADQEAEKTTWWGGPLSSTLVRSVEGRISDETWEEMLAVLRRRFKETGTTERRGAARQWTLSGRDGRRGHLIATLRDGRTDLEVFYANPTLAVPFYIIPLIFSIIAIPFVFAGLGLSGFTGFAVLMAIIGMLLGGGRAGLGTISGKSRKQVREIVDELVEIGEKGTTTRERTSTPGEASPKTTSRTSGPYLQIPDDEFEGDLKRRAESERRRVE